MIDTHCHLDVAAFDADRDDVVARATAAGVSGMLVPAIRPNTWRKLRDFARRNRSAGVRWAIGVHPQIVPELEDDERGDLEQRLADEAAGAIAIGECGLDKLTPNRELQETIFRMHVRVARALQLPLVVHVLGAHDVAPRILREEGCTGGILHSYSGGADLVHVYSKLGMYFSFAGPITYPNARKPLEAARAVPRELLLVETDSPDQSPRRGQRCEPAFLGDVVAGLAAAREESPEEMAALTVRNTCHRFGLADVGDW
jgi:TatD DNase family protein